MTPEMKAQMRQMMHYENKIKQLTDQIAQLTAPPVIEVSDGPVPETYAIRVTWRGYRHLTVIDRQMYREELELREHVNRTGVMQCVRAHAEELWGETL